MLNFFLFSLLIYACVVVFIVFINILVYANCGYFDWEDFFQDTKVVLLVCLPPLVFANLVKVAVIVYNVFWG